MGTGQFRSHPADIIMLARTGRPEPSGRGRVDGGHGVGRMA